MLGGPEKARKLVPEQDHQPGALEDPLTAVTEVERAMMGGGL